MSYYQEKEPRNRQCRPFFPRFARASVCVFKPLHYAHPSVFCNLYSSNLPFLGYPWSLFRSGRCFEVVQMLRGFAVQLGSSLATGAAAKDALRPIVSYSMPAQRKQTAKSLASQYELLYQASYLKEILKVDHTESILKHILYAERKNKTARKVAKKHRKKKGKTVNLRRS